MAPKVAISEAKVSSFEKIKLETLYVTFSPGVTVTKVTTVTSKVLSAQPIHVPHPSLTKLSQKTSQFIKVVLLIRT